MTKVAKSFNNISIPMNNPLSRLIIISFVQTSKLAYKYRLHLWIYVRGSPQVYRVSLNISNSNPLFRVSGYFRLVDN